MIESFTGMMLCNGSDAYEHIGQPAHRLRRVRRRFAIGLFFIFVWAPQPWGWQGFDHYHELALALARGGSFRTMEVPWGYAYFLAPFYRLFGDQPWIPLVVQAAINASVPLLVYHLARRPGERRLPAARPAPLARHPADGGGAAPWARGSRTPTTGLARHPGACSAAAPSTAGWPAP